MSKHTGAWRLPILLTLAVVAALGVAGCSLFRRNSQELAPTTSHDTVAKAPKGSTTPLPPTVSPLSHTADRPAATPTPHPAPFAITLGPDQNLWFTEFEINRIGRITPMGQLTVFELKAGGFPERLTAGPDDTIWFTDPAGNRIGRLELGGASAYVPLPTPDSGPAAITIGPDGNLWFTEHAANRIGKITPLGSVTEYILPHGGGPAGIVTGPDNNLYFAENKANRIDRMSPDGRIDEFALPNPHSLPNGIIKGPDGNLWFTEIAAQKVGRLTPRGDMTEYSLPVRGAPLSITDGPDHSVWVAVPEAHALCRIGIDGRATAFYLPTTVTPSFVTAGPDGNLWFTQPSGKIGRFTPSGLLTEFSSTPEAETAAAPSESARQRHLMFVPP